MLGLVISIDLAPVFTATTRMLRPVMLYPGWTLLVSVIVWVVLSPRHVILKTIGHIEKRMPNPATKALALLGIFLVAMSGDLRYGDRPSKFWRLCRRCGSIVAVVMVIVSISVFINSWTGWFSHLVVLLR